MNTFAVLLLAFPFYLAVNGRLIAYTSLVNAALPASATPTSPSNTITPISPVS